MQLKQLNMVLHISQNKTLQEAQEEFNKGYRFLSIEFYTDTEPGFARKHLNNSLLLTVAGLRRNGELELNDFMTVGELENCLLKKFGLNVQVSRRSGTLWLETTMTGNWTLKQQNDHGRELSEPLQMANSIIKDDEIDYD